MTNTLKVSYTILSPKSLDQLNTEYNRTTTKRENADIEFRMVPEVTADGRYKLSVEFVSELDRSAPIPVMKHKAAMNALMYEIAQEAQGRNAAQKDSPDLHVDVTTDPENCVMTLTADKLAQITIPVTRTTDRLPEFQDGNNTQYNNLAISLQRALLDAGIELPSTNSLAKSR